MTRLRMAVAAMTVVMMLSAGSGSVLAAKGGQLGGVSANPGSINFGTVGAADCNVIGECMSSVYFTNNAPVSVFVTQLWTTSGEFYLTSGSGIGGGTNPDQCFAIQTLAPGATCLVYVGFCSVVFCASTESWPAGRYTSSVYANWSDGARTYNLTIRLSARLLGA